MKGTRLFSIVGGVLLIVAAFLPYGFSTWASGSTCDVTINVLNRVNNENLMLDLIQEVGLSNTMSAITLGLVVAAFFLLLVGGILALVKTGGGSVAGPVGMVILTAVPFIVGSGSAITGLGIGYWIGWAGAIICLIGTLGKSKLQGVNLFVRQNVNVQSPASTPPPPPNK